MATNAQESGSKEQHGNRLGNNAKFVLCHIASAIPNQVQHFRSFNFCFTSIGNCRFSFTNGGIISAVIFVLKYQMAF
jgi:hypothetical protein